MRAATQGGGANSGRLPLRSTNERNPQEPHRCPDTSASVELRQHMVGFHAPRPESVLGRNCTAARQERRFARPARLSRGRDRCRRREAALGPRLPRKAGRQSSAGEIRRGAIAGGAVRPSQVSCPPDCAGATSERRLPRQGGRLARRPRCTEKRDCDKYRATGIRCMTFRCGKSCANFPTWKSTVRVQCLPALPGST